MKIAIDFDGTCVEHRFPEVGADCPHAVDVMIQWMREGHELILFTMRSGKYLEDAIEWFRRREIHLHGIQYDPNQTRWTASNKCYAETYIDDASIGCPLIYCPAEGRPYVDWLTVRDLVADKIKVNPDPNPVKDITIPEYVEEVI